MSRGQCGIEQAKHPGQSLELRCALRLSSDVKGVFEIDPPLIESASAFFRVAGDFHGIDCSDINSESPTG
jgi:hypothetical protein